MFALLSINEKNVVWDEAFFAPGISDMKGIKRQITVDWAGRQYTAGSGIESKDVFTSGVSGEAPLTNGSGKYDLALEIHLKVVKR